MSTAKWTLFFLGTDGFAITSLERLCQDPQFSVLGVVTPPDRPVGRSQVLEASPVKRFAQANGISIFHSPQEVLTTPVDFLVVASYGRILSKEVLKHPRVACVNVHPSLLPRYRGASPIQSALLHGDSITGVCVMRLVEALDAGPIYSLCEQAIGPTDDAETLRVKLADAGAELLAQSLPGIALGEIEPQEQDDSKATYCVAIDRDDGTIDWTLEDAATVDRKRRAYHPWPGISTRYAGKRLKLLEGHPELATSGSLSPGTVMVHPDGAAVATIQGTFVLHRVQLEGKTPTLISDFVRGHPGFIGAVLT